MICNPPKIFGIIVRRGKVLIVFWLSARPEHLVVESVTEMLMSQGDSKGRGTDRSTNCYKKKVISREACGHDFT